MASFEKRPNGKWQAKVRRGGVNRSKVFATRRDAKAWADRLEAEVELGVAASSSKLVFLYDVIEKYLTEITPRKKSQKVERYTLGVVSKYLGNITIQALTADDVVNYIDLRLRSVKPATISKEVNKLGHVIDTAYSLWGVGVADNPVKKAKRILQFTQTLRVDDARDRRLAEGEYELLTSINSKLADAVVLAVETGLRRGEFVRVSVDDIDGRVLHVRNTKTGKDRRVPLSDKALAVIEKYQGAPFTSGPALTKSFTRWCKQLGIDNLRFHDLRHEATSRLFERGFSLQEVASITGHDSWVSLKRYTHVRAADLVDRL